MERLEVRGAAVRSLYGSLGVKGLIKITLDCSPVARIRRKGVDRVC